MKTKQKESSKLSVSRVRDCSDCGVVNFYIGISSTRVLRCRSNILASSLGFDNEVTQFQRTKCASSAV